MSLIRPNETRESRYVILPNYSTVLIQYKALVKKKKEEA